MVVMPDKTVVVSTHMNPSFTRKMQEGQTSPNSDDTPFPDIPIVVFELAAILRHDTTFKLIDHLARLQVVVVVGVAEEHDERLMIQKALAGDIEEEDEAALQKNGKKRHTKTDNLAIEFSVLNMAFVEV